MKHNEFNTYRFKLNTNGNTYTVKDGGEWVEVISNGKNSNSSNFYLGTRLDYVDLKDKICRITWDFETSDPYVFAQTAFSNVSLGLYTAQTAGSDIGTNRTAKVDLATTNTMSNYLGKQSVDFIPSELFEGLTESNYLGWSFGFRSSNDGLVFRIIQFDFEVHK